MDEQQTIEQLILRSLVDDLTDAEQEELSDWINQSQANKQRYELISSRWQDGQMMSRWESIDETANWQSIEQKAKKPPFLPNLPKYLLRYAAVITLIIATIWILQRQKLTTIQNDQSQAISYVLPDGSEVWLKQHASIAFDEDSFLQKRDVQVAGEVFFEVQKDTIPFTVEANRGKVEVLGTSFNVVAGDKSTEVFLVEGSVQYSSNSQQTLMIPMDRLTDDGKAAT